MTDRPDKPPSLPPEFSLVDDATIELVRGGMLAPSLSPGAAARLADYVILRELGVGGMGVVLLARRDDEAAPVAVKLLKPALVGNAAVVRRFLAEGRHMQKLEHRHIVRVHDVVDRPEGPYFTMDYCPAGSLADRLAGGEAMAAEEVARVALGTAEALALAHSRGIIHRDVKPANILLDEQGEAVVTDFGLLRTMFNDSILMPREGPGEGTVMYMSPAVAAGRAEDTRCDIYSLGAVMYAMLTGSPPYEGDDVHAIAAAIATGPPTPIRARAPRAHAGLARVAQWAMARDLRDRYAEMEDVIADLRRVSAGAQPLGPHGRGVEDRKRGRGRAGAIAAMVAIVLMIGSGFWVLGPGGSEPAAPGTAPVDPAARHRAAVPAGMPVIRLPLAEGVDLPLVLIPAGRTPPSEAVFDEPFFVGQFEVTQEQYETVMGENPSTAIGPNLPVDNVSYLKAEAFCRKLSARLGATVTLPTVEQLEYACRAGGSGAYCFGDDPGLLQEYAWYQDNSGGTVHPVGLKRANAFGLFDVHGNVLELSSTRVSTDGSGAIVKDDTLDPKDWGVVSVDGAFHVPADRCRAASRVSSRAANSATGMGFRVMMSADDGWRFTGLPDRPAVAWRQAGELSVPAICASATMLDGKLAVAGGRIFPMPPWAATRLQLVDPSTGRCQLGPHMMKERFNHRLETLTGPDGRTELYAVGGYDGWGGLADVERYSPDKGAWAPVAHLAETRGHGIMTAVVNNTLYALGGHVNDEDMFATVEAYDRHRNEWRPCSPIARNGEPYPLQMATAVTVGERVYLFGGTTPQGPSRATLIYDTTANAWAEGAAMPCAGTRPPAFYADGCIYVLGCGGGGPLSRALWCYQIDADAWHYVARVPEFVNHFAAFAWDGRTLFLAGAEIAGQGDRRIDTLWIEQAGLPTE